MCLGLPTFDNIAFSAPREIGFFKKYKLSSIIKKNEFSY